MNVFSGLTHLFLGITLAIASLFHPIAQKPKIITHILPTPTHIIAITPTPTSKPSNKVLRTGTELIPTYAFVPSTQTPVPTQRPTPTNTTQINIYYPPAQHQTSYSTPTSIPTSLPVPVVTPDCSSVSSTIAAIKSEGQPAINTATAGEISLLESRGIDPNSPQGQQQMQAVLFPYQNQTNTAIAQYCFSVANTGCSCP